MKVGIVGPHSLSQHLDSLAGWCDVQWGTENPTHAAQWLSEGSPVDAVVVQGDVRFLTAILARAVSAAGVRGFALAQPSPETEWINHVDGFTSISTLDELRDSRAVLSSSVAVETSAPPTTDDARGRVVAVWGPFGAPGITTIAVSLAVVAAREGQNVVLCDADTRGASVALGLGVIDDAPGFAAACRLAGRGELTDADINRLAVRPESRFTTLSALTGLPRASRWAEIAPAKSREVVAHLRRLADLVVIDVGSGVEDNEWIDDAPQRDGAARAILADADLVIAVGLCDIVGVSRLIRGLDEVATLCPNPLVVLNRAGRQSAREAQDAVERFAGHDVAVTIYRDSRNGLDDTVSRASTVKPLWREVVARLAEPTSKARR